MAKHKTMTTSAPPRSPDRSAIQQIANAALQSKHVAVEKLDDYIFRTYALRTSPTFFYTLKCRPSFNIRLLRHEESWLENEAGALTSIGGRADVRTPRLISFDNASAPVTGNVCLISGPFSGAMLSDIEPTLSRQALATIDRSLGQYVRQLSSITGPLFGSIRQSQGIPGSQSWARVFAFLLEAVMRDGEDSLISLPYEGMRDLVRKHRAALDKITQPRLVLLELASDKNVLVDAANHRVNGLLDYSTAFWGDPFMSDCFYKPTQSFAEGFGKLPNQSSDERIRQYFYVLYHSLLAIVRHCYRPSDGGDEMEARRNLTSAIKQLNGI